MRRGKYGVFKRSAGWFYRHYGHNAEAEGPYATCAEAMEALLRALGFAVEKS